MTDISKDAVDALLQGVTDGPWMVAGVRGKVEGQSVHNVFRYNAGEKRDEQICAVWYDTKTGLGAKDARFIAAARELVPALRAALDEAEARAVKAEAERDEAYLKGFSAGQTSLQDVGVLQVIDSPELHTLRVELDAANALLREARSGLCAYTGGASGACEMTILRIDAHLGAKP